MKRVEQPSFRWRKLYEKNGLIELTDTRKTNSSRLLKRELTMALERQAARDIKKARSDRKEAVK